MSQRYRSLIFIRKNIASIYSPPYFLLTGILLLSMYLIVFSTACSKGDSPMIKADSLKLPEKLDGWKLEGPPRRITRETIFDYMDGGGELYLAYKFNQLLVYKYLNGSNNEILVEIYEMLHSDEAFGLLSLDWTGEPVVLKPELAELPENQATPNLTALYGEGLLRAGVGNLYLRVLAERESAGIKEAILQIGKSVAVMSQQPALPEILSLIQPDPKSRWRIKKDRTSYFHSHLILNSLYYLSHENILHLSQDCEGLYTEWAEAGTDIRRTARLFLLRYPEAARARQALSDFQLTYVSEKSHGGSDKGNSELKPEGLVQLEEGWLAWKLSDSCLALVFEAPGPEAAKEILNQIRWQ